MHRVCLKKDGTLIEMQSGGDEDESLMKMRLNTLKQNALNAGYKEDEFDVKWITDEKWATIKAAIPVPDPQSDPLTDLVSTLLSKGILVNADLPTSISAIVGATSKKA